MSFTRLPAALCLLCLIEGTVVAQAGVFLTVKSYPTGELPVAAAVADFNGDGLSDIVSANRNDKNVSVLLGKGDGTFAAANTFAVGDGAADVASADLNGDGQADLVVSDGDPYVSGAMSISIALGNGDGTFRTPAAIKIGNNPMGIAIGDLNHDGIPDVAIAMHGALMGSSGALAVLIGKGDGSFAPPVSYPINHNGERLVLADLNGDGNLDVAMAVQHNSSPKNGLAIFLGNGDGTFQAGKTSVSGDAYDVAAADLNGDGKLDLALVESESTFILIGNGDGTFQPAVSYTPGASSVEIADINHDGVPDLVLGGNVTTLFGHGDGTFGAPTIYATGETFARLGYFNRDNNLDVVTKAAYSAIGVTLGNRNGTFRAGLSYFAGFSAGPLAAADFNGDGNLDMVVGAANNNFSTDLVLYLGEGHGGFQPGTFFGSVTAETVFAGDFNGDGRQDVLTTYFSDSGIHLYLGNGDGTFGPAITTFVANFTDLTLAAGDLNGDGLPDALVTRYPANLATAFLSNGDGTFRDAGDYATGTEPTSPIIADFNGDGISDFAVANASSGTVGIYLGNGDGTFKKPKTTSASGASYLGAADLNGDGETDLVVGGSSLQIFAGNGDGTFQAPQTLSSNSGPIQIADVDGDGKLDVVFDEDLVGLMYLRGDGRGNFRAPQTISVGSQFVGGFLFRDLTGDGLPELIAVADASMAVVINTSGHKSTAPVVPPWRDN